MRWGCSVSQSFSKFALVGLLTGLCGCAMMPAAGPQGIEVNAARSDTSLKYGLVKLTPESIQILHEFEPRSYAQLGLYELPGAFTDRRPPANIKFGIGDVVSVTIFEAAAGGLFIPVEAGVRPGNFVTLPNVSVDNDGNISVPYAGTVPAVGRTNIEVQNEIVDKIKNRAIEPQVVVALANQNTSLVSVIGDVNLPVRYPAASAGAQDRITDAITRAGGIKNQGYSEFVMLDLQRPPGGCSSLRGSSMSRIIISTCSQATEFMYIKNSRNSWRSVQRAHRGSLLSMHGV